MASARRLATASAVVGELVKARASVSSFKSSLGKVQSPEPAQIADWSSGLHTLAQSTDGSDLVVVDELIQTLGVDAPFGTSVDVAVDLVLAKEVELRPPPPPPEKSQLELLLERMAFQTLSKPPNGASSDWEAKAYADSSNWGRQTR